MSDDALAIDPNDPEVRALHAELKVLETNVLLARSAFARANGFTFDNKRDMDGVLGRRSLISTSDYRTRYQRGGIAARLVDVLPDACWRGEMEIIEDESKETYTPFEQAWHDLDQRLQIRSKLRRVDRLAGLSTYAVLLIGTRDGMLEQELPQVIPSDKSSKAVIFLAPFSGGGGTVRSNVQVDRTLTSGGDATIHEYDEDKTSARFGLPQTYLLNRVGITENLQKPVHWSRILHVAEGLLDDDVFGIPTLERVWNLLDDLEKVTGGGAEAFWLRANQGVHVNVDKDMQLPEFKDTMSALKEQVEAYKHGLDRWIRTRGVEVTPLGSDVANFQSPADAILTQIAGAKGMPKRILTGSEMGELASSQDRDNWKDQINGRQSGYLAPYVVRPLVDRLILYGYLPPPKKSVDAYEVHWPHIQTLTEQEKAEGAKNWAMTLIGTDPVFTDAEIRDKWYAMPPLTDEQRQEIADRAAEKVKQQQEAMAAAQPAAPDEPKVPPQLVKAAESFELTPGDEEIVRVLQAALDVGSTEVVAAIVGLTPLPPPLNQLTGVIQFAESTPRRRPRIVSQPDDYRVVDRLLHDIRLRSRMLGDVAGHDFHGNQWTGGGFTADAVADKHGIDKATVDHLEAKIRSKATTEAEHAYAREMAVAEAIIRRDSKPGEDSYTQNTHPVVGQPQTRVYTAERLALHDRIIEQYLNDHIAKFGGAPPTGLKEPVVTFMSGMPGAGKSTSAQDLQTAATITIDPDSMKKYFPEYRNGLGAATVARETGDVADKLMNAAAAKRMNIVVDGTMKTSGTPQPYFADGALGKMAAFKDLGYRVETRFVDVSVNESIQNTVTRFHEQFAKTGEGRYVTPNWTRQLKDEQHGNLPKSSFDRATHTTYKGKPLVDAWTHDRGYVPGASDSRKRIASFGTITPGGAGR